MKVSEAVQRRRSVRAFTKDAVSSELIRELLIQAARAPSGGNLQPWKVCLINGERMTEFRAIMEERLSGKPHPDGEEPEYEVYPPNMIEPYRTARFEVGEDMYGLLGIPREDKAARLRWFAENYRFFGAPAAIFCFADRMMGAPQWSDLGMFLQTFMLLLEENDIQSCAQECWHRYPRTVGDFCAMGENDMLFCGISIGHADEQHPVNKLRSKRLPPDLWLKTI